MTKQYLWISKDSQSKQLSQSSRKEESRIRRHVQRNRLETPGAVHRYEHTRIPQPINPPLVPLNTQEKRSLHYFISHTALQWSGWQDFDFWNGIAIQAGRQDQATAHALIAIAAWHEYSLTASKSALAPQLRQLALCQQSKAVAMARSTHLSHCASLISCLIFASLQSYSGEYQEYRLLRSGAAIFEEMRTRGEVDSHIVLRQDKDTIAQEVSALISQQQERLCMMGDLPAALATSAKHLRSRMILNRGVALVPASFQSLRCARDCLEAILNWGHDHIVESLEGSGNWSTFSGLLKGSLERWECALNTSWPAKTPCHALKLLQIASLNGMILLLTCFEREETSYDSHTVAFGRMMELISQISSPETPSGRVSFGVDCGLIDIVAFIGSRCRDRHTRQAALHWLQKSPRIEGDRFSIQTAHIVEVWSNLEETERTSATARIPESGRWKLLVGERYHDQRLLKLMFSSYPYHPNPAAKVTEIWIRIPCEDSLQQTGAVVYSGERPTLSPDTIFSPGHAAFWDNERGVYHHLHSSAFHFPIPRA